VEIEDLYVTREYRSGGIGARLIDAIADWSTLHRVRYVSAYSSSRNVDAILRFYRSCGFESWSVQVFRDLSGPSDESPRSRPVARPGP
jgi:GNAT superfamily N-acetyltransferase